MKRIIAIMVGALLVTSLLLGAVACGEDKSDGSGGSESTEGAAGKVTILRLAMPWPAGDPITDNVQEHFVDKFNAAQDQYRIEIHPGGSLLALPDSLEAVQTGGVEMAGFGVALYGSVAPEFKLSDLPFAVNSIEANSEYNTFLTGIYDKILTEKFNMKTAYTMLIQGFDVISKKPVETLDDWKGLLCQVQTPGHGAVVDAMGAAGVPVEFQEAYQSLQRGVTDATLQSSSMIVMFKLNEVADYITKCYVVPGMIEGYINLDVYNGMPDDIKAIFDQCGKDAQKAIDADMIARHYANYEAAAEMGMTIYELPADERQKWADRLQANTDAILAEIDPAVAEEFRAFVKQLNEKYPYQP